VTGKPFNPRTLSDSALLRVWKEKTAKLRKEKRFVEDKEHKLSTQIPNIQAGDLNDVNKIIWPFYFTTPYLEIQPNTSVSRFISITQEAAFVWTYMVRSVFEKVDLGGGVFNWNYIDPNDFQDGIAENLQIEFADQQSSRTFFFNPININHIGHSQEPQKLDTPMMIPANNSIEVKFFNNDAAKIYIPFVTFYGYRVRTEDAQEILGLVNK
jgi:hypothetical protein